MVVELNKNDHSFAFRSSQNRVFFRREGLVLTRVKFSFTFLLFF